MDRLKELNILLLEDSHEFAENIIEFLALYFKSVYHKSNKKDALELFREKKIDVIISDIKVEDGNGLNFIKDVRELNSTVPIVILSAYKDEEFLFEAIPLNIMSYELKPLNYDRFITLLKKISLIFEPPKTQFYYKNLEYSFETKILYVNNIETDITKKERLLLELMLLNSHKIVSKDMIQRNIYDDKLMSESAIKNLIFRFRKKLGVDLITSVSGVGYKLS